MNYHYQNTSRHPRTARGSYNSRNLRSHPSSYDNPSHPSHRYSHHQRRPSDDYGPDYHKEPEDPQKKMRKFLTYCLVALFTFCIFIEFEIDSIADSDYFENLPKMPKFRLNFRSKRQGFGEDYDYDDDEELNNDSTKSLSTKRKRRNNIKQIPLGFIPTHSGEYKVKLFHLSPDFIDWEFHDVTLTTQCSANRLFNMKTLAERWEGPISVAIFIPGKEAGIALAFIDGLRYCWPDTIGARVSFHLAYPTSQEADVSSYDDINLDYIMQGNCERLLEDIENFGTDNYEHKIPYPHNVLRNAARNGVMTEFVFLIDVDVIPSVNLRDMFMEYAYRNNMVGNKYLPPPNELKEDKRVFVVPTFEIKKGYPIPTTKKALLGANSDGKIRPFHNQTCWWCHAPEEHEKWLKLPDPSPKKLNAGFYADWAKSWEPFYIARRNVPLFDERFKQYGYDRIEQICELHLMGYDFIVLDKAFLIHKGWKEATKEERKKETYRNWILFNFHFHQMLLRVHNENEKSCAPIERWEPKGKKAIEEIRNKKANLRVKTADEVIKEHQKIVNLEAQRSKNTVL